MRIISGQLKGRQFSSPKNHKSHPMSDKMRGALFNALGDIEDLKILDAFGGSGALSFESASRGAKGIIVIESDHLAQKIISKNIIDLDLINSIKLIKAPVNSWLSTNEDAYFDLILADPPYDDLQLQLIRKLAERMSNNGIMILSWPKSAAIPRIDNFELVKQKKYGNGNLVFYKQIS
jgi:16S rRNA (guanine(966)-N(2))-methyltransferase RsmD